VRTSTCLFDTDAISEVLEPRTAAGYVRWLAAIPREEPVKIPRRSRGLSNGRQLR
jgi:hypothetical protein